jgi:hypothetical protein
LAAGLLKLRIEKETKGKKNKKNEHRGLILKSKRRRLKSFILGIF